jgi:CO/xanthine dehydrogenase FAD-binding subunit
MDRDRIEMGAMVTHGQVCASSLIRQKAPILADACATVGSPQIRNMGTLVGNIVNAMPAADAASALIALGARASVAGPDRHVRVLPVDQLYRELGESFVDSTREIVTGLEFEVDRPNSGASFQRLARRKALALPTLNVSVFIRLDGSLQRFEEARIVVGPVSPLPFRSRAAEAVLSGAPVTREAIDMASAAASREATPRRSVRGGKEYRKEMVNVLVRRAILQALTRIDVIFKSLSLPEPVVTSL